MRYLFIILLALVVSACGISESFVPVEVADGYFYERNHKVLVYDYKPFLRLVSGRLDTVMADVTDCRAFGDYILIKQKSDYTDENGHLVSYYIDGKKCRDVEKLQSIYKHGLNNIYYFILEKDTRNLAGPFVYDELIAECDSLGIIMF